MHITFPEIPLVPNFLDEFASHSSLFFPTLLKGSMCYITGYDLYSLAAFIILIRPKDLKRPHTSKFLPHTVRVLSFFLIL